ncbi:MAG: SGNH/GDSL hydrolase family protein [Bacteroidales bacterium]|nr:SGNH/GDSL hydrolase family protein [Bacteroidales bacterium]
MKTTRIAALGDSITKGVVLNDQNRYSAAEQSFLDILSSELDLRVDNYGKFGCTVGYGNSVIERHATDIAESDYTFIEYGGNDCDFDWIKIAQDPHGEHKARTPLEEFTEELSSLVAKIRKLGSIPVLITLPPILSDTYFSFFSRSMSDEQKNNIKEWLGGDIGIITRWHESYNRALFQVANQTHTQILDITTPFDTFRGDLTSLYCADGIHPNAHGHKLIAHTIINMYL